MVTTILHVSFFLFVMLDLLVLLSLRPGFGAPLTADRVSHTRILILRLLIRRGLWTILPRTPPPPGFWAPSWPLWHF